MERIISCVCGGGFDGTCASFLCDNINTGTHTHGDRTHSAVFVHNNRKYSIRDENHDNNDSGNGNDDDRATKLARDIRIGNENKARRLRSRRTRRVTMIRDESSQPTDSNASIALWHIVREFVLLEIRTECVLDMRRRLDTEQMVTRIV